MEGSNNFANLEALCNICANLSEILALANGAPLLFMWWIPQANGVHGYGLKLFLLGVGMIALGIGVPFAISALVGSKSEAGILAALIVGVLVLLLAIGLSLMAFFLPIIFATRIRRKERKTAIIILNLLGIIPICWLIAFIMACMPDKSGSQESLTTFS